MGRRRREVEKRRRGRGDEMNMIVNCDCDCGRLIQWSKTKNQKEKIRRDREEVEDNIDVQGSGQIVRYIFICIYLTYLVSGVYPEASRLGWSR